MFWLHRKTTLPTPFSVQDARCCPVCGRPFHINIDVHRGRGLIPTLSDWGTVAVHRRAGTDCVALAGLIHGSDHTTGERVNRGVWLRP